MIDKPRSLSAILEHSHRCAQLRFGHSIDTVAPEVLREASRRLGIVSVAIMGILGFSVIVFRIFPLFGGPQLPLPMRGFDVMSLAILALSVAVFLLARSPRLSDQRKLDLGLGYEIVLAMAIGIIMRLLIEGTPIPVMGVSEVCIIILIFPAIVPNTPRKTWIAGCIAASMDPLGHWLAGLGGAEVPTGGELLQAYVWNYFCAFLAVIPSKIMNRLGREVSEAREVGQYRLVEMLGRGGMGEVWQGEHRMLARPAAIKLIRAERLGDEEADRHAVLQRFEREARATAELRSTHTITLYDFGITDEGVFYYVMELLDGLDLHSFVDRFGPLQPERVVYILRQVCHSLMEAHERGMVHRDIKPANLFLCRLGPDHDFVKVLDFGLVKPPPESPAGGASLTQEGVTFGTPGFMAPEMAMGASPIDGRADLYALGCVGYWLLAGVPVFEGDTPLATVLHHVKTEPEPPSRRTEIEIPCDLEGIILQCLAKEPDQRPVSARVLDEMLEGCEGATAWSGRKAADWWGLHLPQADASTLVTTVAPADPA